MRSGAMREGAILRAHECMDGGAYLEDLARRVAIPTESQVPEQASELYRYQKDEIGPSFEKLGFDCTLIDNPVPDRGPAMVATRRNHSRTTIGYWIINQRAIEAQLFKAGANLVLLITIELARLFRHLAFCWDCHTSRQIFQIGASIHTLMGPQNGPFSHRPASHALSPACFEFSYKVEFVPLAAPQRP